MSPESSPPPSEAFKDQPVEDVVSKKVWPEVDFTQLGSTTPNTATTVADEIRDELITVLVARGIDPQKVLLSGYNGEAHDKDAVFIDTEVIREEIYTLSREANEMYGNGDFDDDPELHDRYKRELVKLKGKLAQAESDRADYFFGDIEDISGSSPFTNNPIYYACTGEGESTIAVYNVGLFPGDKTITDTIMSATPEQVDQALILRFHPRFEYEED